MRELNSKLTKLDYFQLVNSFLFVGLGVIIILRSMKSETFLLPLIFALVFMGFGIYRLRFFVRYFKGKRKKT